MAPWVQHDLQVQFVAMEVKILLHAGDISIVNILLVEIFDDWAMLVLSSLRKASVWRSLIYLERYNQRSTEKYRDVARGPSPPKIAHSWVLSHRDGETREVPWQAR
jgi:hypothetical protein